MKRLNIEPKGWPVKLKNCPPGFFVYKNRLCIKTEYESCEAFNESGEYFWGGVDTKRLVSELEVQPCEPKWIETEE